MTNVVNISDAPLSKRDKLDLFCEALANGLSREKAYIEAGYSEHNCRANANKYYRQNAEYITQHLSEHVGSHAPTALKVILQIMNDPNEKGGIRLKAAQDVMDRSGFSAKQKIELTTKDAKDLSTEELTDAIKQLVQDDPKLAEVFHLSKSMGE